MKKPFLFLLLMYGLLWVASSNLPVAIAQEGESLPIELVDFSAGLDSQHLPDKISLRSMQDCSNFRSDRVFGLSRRTGNQREAGCMNTSSTKLWSFVSPTGEEWLIRLDCRGSLIAGRRFVVAGTTSCFSVCVSTRFLLSTVEPTDADSGLGRIWFTNKENGLMSWDGGTFFLHPNAPKAARVAVFKNRIILSDVSNEQSSSRLSGELNGDDWNDDSRFSTSPMSIRIGGVNDGAKLFDFFPGLGEGIYFKANSMYRLLGNDQRDFQVQQISPEIGTIYPNTISQRGGFTIFLSNRGLDAYSPPFTFTKIGESIQNLLDPLSSAQNSVRSASIDSQADWSQGFSTPIGHISTTLSPGSIRPANRTYKDTIGPDWTAGTYRMTSSILSTSSVGSLTFISTPQASVSNFSFETADATLGDLDLAQNWDGVGTFSGLAGVGNTGIITRNGSPLTSNFDGNFHMQLVQIWNIATGVSQSMNARLVIYDSNNNIVSVSSINLGTVSSGWMPTQVNTSALAGSRGKIAISANINGPDATHYSASTLTTTQQVYFSTSLFIMCISSADQPTVGSRFTSTMEFDYVFMTPRPASEFRANYQSQVFDLLISSPQFDPLRYTMSAGTISVGIRTSTASHCCFGTEFLTSSGTITQANRNRYVVYSATFSTDGSTNPTTIRLNDITIGSWTTGYFTTGIQDLGTNVTSPRLFTAAVFPNGGGVLFQVQSSSDRGFFPESNWVDQPVNTKIRVPVNQYIAVRAFFDTNASTAVPLVENMTFNYNLVENFPQPHSLTHKESYYLFYTSVAAQNQRNDRIAIFNRNNAFDQFSGSSISASTVYNNTIILGDALQTGNIYSMDTSTDGTDNRSNVDSYFVTKRLDGGNPDAIKTWDKIYITLSRVDVSSSQIFSVEYKLDGSSTSYSAANVEMSTGSSMITAKSYIPIDLPREGRHIEFKIKELTQRTSPYSVSRMRIYGTIKEVE